jgi:predicted amidohydrolase
MARNVKIATLQLPAWTEGKTAAERKQFRVDALQHWLEEAGREGADLVCMGETCTGEQLIEDAYTGPATRMVQGMAAHDNMHVIFPIRCQVEGVIHNSALVIDHKGNIVGRYDKVHPTRSELGAGTVAGNDFPVFDLAFGRVGVCICHDLSFPESTRVLGIRGAEIIVWPHWWSGWGEELCMAVIQSRAIDNGAWLAQVTFGTQDGTAWQPGMIMGRSGVVAPDGLILSSAGRYVGMSAVTVDLDKPRLAHSFTWPNEDDDIRESILADRRPDAYAPLADPSYVIPAVPPKERNQQPARALTPALQVSD